MIYSPPVPLEVGLIEVVCNSKSNEFIVELILA